MALMNITDEMASERARAMTGRWIDTPIWPEDELLKQMADQLMIELRKSGVKPDQETTRILSAYQTWVASQG